MLQCVHSLFSSTFSPPGDDSGSGHQSLHHCPLVCHWLVGDERKILISVNCHPVHEGLTTLVYRKPTHTDRYIPFHSHHHQRTITGVLRCMRDRAHRICDPSCKEPELQHLQHVFQANGFPKELVRKTLAPQPPSVTSSGTSDEPPKILCVPYIRGLSEKLERVCTPLGVRAAFKPMRTLRQTLMQLKNQIPEEKRRSVVY